MAKVTFERTERNVTIANDIPVGHFFKDPEYKGDSWYIRIHPVVDYMERDKRCVLAADICSGMFVEFPKNRRVTAAESVRMAVK